MCDERLFSPQAQMLATLAIPFSIYKMTIGSTIQDIARDILETSPPHFAIIGLSMGGIVALEIMRIAPERITHLALLNTTPHEDRSGPQRNDQIRRAQQGELMNVMREDLKPGYMSPSTQQDDLYPLIMKMGLDLGAQVFVRQSLALMTRKSAVPYLTKITCPTLILTGADDMICPSEIQAEMKQSIAHSDLHIIPQCGHLSTLEAPENVNQLLHDHWGFSRRYSLNQSMGKTLHSEQV